MIKFLIFPPWIHNAFNDSNDTKLSINAVRKKELAFLDQFITFFTGNYGKVWMVKLMGTMKSLQGLTYSIHAETYSVLKSAHL